MRSIITAIVLAALAVAGLASPADAARKATIRQVRIAAVYDGYTVTTVAVTIARTDHRNPQGVKICLRQRDRNSGEHSWGGCGVANAAGIAYFTRNDPVTQGLQYRIYHPASRHLRAFVGAWWSANSGL